MLILSIYLSLCEDENDGSEDGRDKRGATVNPANVALCLLTAPNSRLARNGRANEARSAGKSRHAASSLDDDDNAPLSVSVSYSLIHQYIKAGRYIGGVPNSTLYTVDGL